MSGIFDGAPSTQSRLPAPPHLSLPRRIYDVILPTARIIRQFVGTRWALKSEPANWHPHMAASICRWLLDQAAGPTESWPGIKCILQWPSLPYRETLSSALRAPTLINNSHFSLSLFLSLSLSFSVCVSFELFSTQIACIINFCLQLFVASTLMFY